MSGDISIKANKNMLFLFGGDSINTVSQLLWSPAANENTRSSLLVSS